MKRLRKLLTVFVLLAGTHLIDAADDSALVAESERNKRRADIAKFFLLNCSLTHRTIRTLAPSHQVLAWGGVAIGMKLYDELLEENVQDRLNRFNPQYDSRLAPLTSGIQQITDQKKCMASERRLKNKLLRDFVVQSEPIESKCIESIHCDTNISLVHSIENVEVPQWVKIRSKRKVGAADQIGDPVTWEVIAADHGITSWHHEMMQHERLVSTLPEQKVLENDQSDDEGVLAHMKHLSFLSTSASAKFC